MGLRGRVLNWWLGISKDLTGFKNLLGLNAPQNVSDKHVAKMSQTCRGAHIDRFLPLA